MFNDPNEKYSFFLSDQKNDWCGSHSTQQKTDGEECLFLLGADKKKDYKKGFISSKFEKNPFICYQGHHGNLGARQAD
jgi:hypothetical protein